MDERYDTRVDQASADGFENLGMPRILADLADGDLGDEEPVHASLTQSLDARELSLGVLGGVRQEEGQSAASALELDATDHAREVRQRRVRDDQADRVRPRSDERPRDDVRGVA